MVNFEFKPVENANEAQWIKRLIEKPWGRSKNANYVAEIIPAGFAAYARIFHPAYSSVENREISWDEIARITGKTSHSKMQWHLITACSHSDICMKGLETPVMGHLPEKQAKALAEILYKYTSTPDNCYFAIWDGWGYPSLKMLEKQTTSFQLYDRSYYLVKGDIRTVIADISSSIPPAIWWPQDRAWCVATDVDMLWSYVGAEKNCIDEILMDKSLEAWFATLDDRADVDGDEINI